MATRRSLAPQKEKISILLCQIWFQCYHDRWCNIALRNLNFILAFFFTELIMIDGQRND